MTPTCQRRQPHSAFRPRRLPVQLAAQGRKSWWNIDHRIVGNPSIYSCDIQQLDNDGAGSKGWGGVPGEDAEVASRVGNLQIFLPRVRFRSAVFSSTKRLSWVASVSPIS